MSEFDLNSEIMPNPAIARYMEQVVVLFCDQNPTGAPGGESAARATAIRGGLVLWVANSMSIDCLDEMGFVVRDPDQTMKEQVIIVFALHSLTLSLCCLI